MLELRSKIGEVLDKSYYKKDYFLIKRNRKSMAVVVPIEDYILFYSDKDVDVYSDKQIKEFLELDKISPEIRNKVNKTISRS